MNIHKNESDLANGAGGLLIGKDNGATSGFCMGVSYYASTAYGEPGVHDDQEGFYILEGRGMAKVGEQEFAVEPGTAFIANRHVPHTLKRNADSCPIKVLWCHGAV